MRKGLSNLLVTLTTVCGLMLFGSGATAQTPSRLYYEVVDIPTLAGNRGEAWAINNFGAVAGDANLSPGQPVHAFLYLSNTLSYLDPSDLTSLAYGVNDSNHVVGEFFATTTSKETAFLYVGGNFQNLGTLGGDSSYASAINNKDQIVGFSDTTNNLASHAFLYENGVMKDIHAVGSESYAAAINDGGQVVGYFREVTSIRRHACVWTNATSGSMIDLTPSATDDNEADAINNSGVIAGTTSTASGQSHAVIYSIAGVGMAQLDSRPSGASGINDKDQVVGGATVTDAFGIVTAHALLWTDGRKIDLNTLIPTNSGWVLKNATAINNCGQIVGWGYAPNGQSHGFLLNPLPKITVCDVVTETEVPPITEPCILRVNHQTNAWTERRRGLLLKIKGPPSTAMRAYVSAVRPSGGHDHGANVTDPARPHGWLRTQKWNTTTNFPPYYTNQNQTGFQESGTTSYSAYSNGLSITNDAQGNSRLYYIAPELCGEEQVTVLIEGDDLANAPCHTQTIDVAIPDLVQIPPNADIEFTGAIAGMHTNNHFGTTRFIQALNALARNYAAENPRGTLPSAAPRLPLNDMSLITGGLFDVDTSTAHRWHPSHIGHRVGFEADVGGAGSGHGLVPQNTTFNRILNEQGWFFFKINEGTHYHLIQTGQGKAFIQLATTALQTVSWDATNRIVTVRLPYDNRGGLDADAVTLTNILTTNGVTVQTPATPAALGAARIREPHSLDLSFRIPTNVTHQTIVKLAGVTTSADRPGVKFRFPEGVGYQTYTVKVPTNNLAPPHFAKSSVRKASGNSGWELQLSDPDQAAVPGSTLIYHGRIDNLTGSTLLLAGLQLSFDTTAPRESYECDIADEFFVTGGVISPDGYDGPLIVLHWLSAPPVGSIGQGTLSLTVGDDPSAETQSAAFSSAFQPQRLSATLAQGKVILSWQETGAGLVLQTFDETEEEPGWLNVDAPVLESGTSRSVELDPSDLIRFFRLASP